ncbi:hypothetical protein [Actinomadura sp. 6N118]|uniref:hypothetical protein n=1 Tax=Actinomadura sp. 6N118 TaxID=3375151 RepID=UPI00378FF417
MANTHSGKVAAVHRDHPFAQAQVNIGASRIPADHHLQHDVQEKPTSPPENVDTPNVPHAPENVTGRRKWRTRAVSISEAACTDVRSRLHTNMRCGRVLRWLVVQELRMAAVLRVRSTGAVSMLVMASIARRLVR